MKLASSLVAAGTTVDSAIEYLQTRDRELRPLGFAELRLDPDSGLLIHGDSELQMTPHAAKQFATRLKINPGYLLKIQDDLAAENANTFLATATGHVQMAIENGTTVTGFLKEKTVPVDPLMLFERLGEHVQGHDFNVGKWWIDDRGLSIRVGDKLKRIEPKIGDIMEAGFDMLVRENTQQTLSVRGTLYRLSCTNGATTQEPLGLRRAILQDGWKDPSARIEMAMYAIDEVIEEVYELSSNLRDMTRMSLDLPPADDDRLKFIRTCVLALGIKSKALAEAVSDGMYQEDATIFGLHNALTRIGRDSLFPKERDLFERSGLKLAANPRLVLEALEDAVLV